MYLCYELTVDFCTSGMAKGPKSKAAKRAKSPRESAVVRIRLPARRAASLLPAVCTAAQGACPHLSAPLYMAFSHRLHPCAVRGHPPNCMRLSTPKRTRPSRLSAQALA